MDEPSFVLVPDDLEDLDKACESASKSGKSVREVVLRTASRLAQEDDFCFPHPQDTQGVR